MIPLILITEFASFIHFRAQSLTTKKFPQWSEIVVEKLMFLFCIQPCKWEVKKDAYAGQTMQCTTIASNLRRMNGVKCHKYQVII